MGDGGKMDEPEDVLAEMQAAPLTDPEVAAMMGSVDMVEVVHPSGHITEVRRRTETPDERAARLMAACTVVEGHTGPVYVDEGGRWYPNPDAAFEVLWDEDADPETTLIHPCDVEKAATPNLIETVETAWDENYDEPDVADVEISKPLASILEGVQYLLEKAAPDVWRPRTKERIQLPPMPLPVHHMADVPDGTRWYPANPDGI